MSVHPRWSVLAIMLAIFALPGESFGEQHRLNHIHKTASIFMDQTEMHVVSVEVLPDGIHIGSSLIFRSKEGSRVLKCDLPDFIPIQQIQKAEVRDSEEWLRGGGRVTFLHLTVLDERSKERNYLFASDTAVRLTPYEAYVSNGNRQWREGRDGGESVRVVEREINDAIARRNASSIAAAQPSSSASVTGGAAKASNIIPEVQISGLARPDLVIQTGHSTSVDALVITPDGKWLVSGGHDFSVRLWDFTRYRQIRLLGHHSREVNALVLCPDQRCVISASNDRTIKVWELPSGRLMRTLSGSLSSVHCLAITRDGHYLVSGSGDPSGFENRKSDFSIRIWDLTTGALLRKLDGHTGIVDSVDISPDGDSIVSGGYDGTVRLWSLKNGTLLNTLSVHRGGVHVQFLPDGRSALLASEGRFEIWDLGKGQQLRQLPGHLRPYLFAFNATNGMFAFPSDRTVEYGYLNSTTAIDGLEREDGADPIVAESVVLSKDGKKIAAGYSDGLIRVRDLTNGSDYDLSGFTAEGDSVAVSSDGRWIATGNRDSTVRVWDTISGALAYTLRSENQEIDGLQFGPDSRLIAASGQNHLPPNVTVVEVWDIRSEQQVARFEEPTRRVESLTFSHSGRLLAGGADNATVRIWDLTTRREVRTLSPAVKAVCFAPDDSWVATGSRDNALTYWNVASGRPFSRLPDLGWAFTVSPDGEWLGSLGWNNEFKVWNLEKVKARPQIPQSPNTVTLLNFNFDRSARTMKGHTEFVTDIAFSPDSRTIVSCSWDGDLKLWSLADGKEIRTFHGHSSGVESVRFSPDGRLLYSTGFDGTLRLWDVAAGTELASLVTEKSKSGWLAVAPNGLFDGRADAMREVAWHDPVDDSLSPLDQYFNDYYYPGLMADLVAGGRPRPTVDIAAVLRIPGLRQYLRQGNQNFRLEAIGDSAYVCFGVKPTDSKMADNLVNAEPESCPFAMRLPPTDHPRELIEALRNPGSARQNVWTGQRDANTAAATLHVFTVGIDRYGPKAGLSSLPASVSSADQIDEFFKRQNSRMLFHDIRIWNNPPLRNEGATLQGIRDRLSEMTKAMKPNDVAFIFLSGHGEIYPDSEMFDFDPYDFVPTRSTDPETFDSGLNTAILAETIRDMPARRIVFVIDACQSGGAVDSLSVIGSIKAEVEERQTQRSTGVRNQPLSPGAVGVYIIAASSPLDSAGQYSGSSVSPLVAALLDGLRNGHPDSEGRVWMQEVVAHIRQGTSAITHSNGKGLSYTPLTSVSGADFPIALAQ